MKLIKNRTLNFGDNVRVYFNLHRKLYSVQKKINGKWLVVAHCKKLLLIDAFFVVNQNGRNRVLKTKRKNVHAFVYGVFTESAFGHRYDDDKKFKCHIKYNPYKYEYFYCDNLITKDIEINKACVVKFDEFGLYGAYLNI